MRTLRNALVAATTVAVALAATAVPAHADVTNPPGRCVGSASFAKGVTGPFTISSSQLQPGDVTKVPVKDTVQWSGSLVGVAPTEREISGYVRIDMPWPLPDINLDSWSGPSSKTQNSDTKEYSLPSATPRGVELRVYGEHREAGTLFCSGSAKIEIEGSTMNAFSIGSLALLAASVALAALASRRGSLALGGVAGFFALLFLGLALLFFGIIPLNSPLLTALPIVGIPIGVAWAKLALLAPKVAVPA